MKSVRRLDELRGDANAVACLPDAPFQNVLDVETPADLADVGILAAERKRGRPAWGGDDTIVFENTSRGLSRVQATGGEW